MNGADLCPRLCFNNNYHSHKLKHEVAPNIKASEQHANQVVFDESHHVRMM